MKIWDGTHGVAKNRFLSKFEFVYKHGKLVCVCIDTPNSQCGEREGESVLEIKVL